MSPWPEIVGGVVSGGAGPVPTKTEKDELAVFPAASVAEHETLVVPSGKRVPDAGRHETGSLPSTRSVAVAEKVTTEPLGPVGATDIGAGSCRFGGVVSCTTTANDEEATFPAASSAEQVTCVEPSANTVPVAGRQLTETGPSTASDAVGTVYETAAPPAPVASARSSACAAIVGAVVSRTCTVNAELALFPAASCARHVTGVEPSANRVPDA